MVSALSVIAHIIRSTVDSDANIGNEELAKAAHMLGKERHDFGTKAIAVFCDRFMRIYKNHNNDISTNGEKYIVERLASVSPKVVLDVGANVGDWSILAEKLFGDAKIHSFEIVPNVFDELIRNTANSSRIIKNKFGLSHCSEKILVNTWNNISSLSSMFNFRNGELGFGEAHHHVQCDVMRGDQYILQNHIEHVDFVKIDVEGAEHHVLNGFGLNLDANFIDVIQFEYGKMNITTHFLLRDYYEMLTNRGFSFGKLYPCGVNFKTYSLEDEDFMGNNYIAVTNNRTDIIKLLSETPPAV